MGDNDTIMVVEREKLFGDDFFEKGYKSHSDVNFEKRILDNYSWMRRGDAEVDPSYKQPIGYVLLVNPQEGTVFAYKRSTKDEEYGEDRLQGKWSWGIGGHIDKGDEEGGNPIYESMLRELTTEEVELVDGDVQNVRVLGYVNDDKQYETDTDKISVGRVHFGILYVVETDATTVNPKDSEVAEGRMMKLSELEEIFDASKGRDEINVESWSEIAVDPLRGYFSK